MLVAELPIRLEEPIFLLVLLLIVPALIMARRSIGGLSPAKASLTLGLRCVLIAVIGIALAHPSWEKRGEGHTTTIILDRSQSIPLPKKREALDFVTRAVELKDRPEDRTAVITVARDATIVAMADPYTAVSVDADPGDLGGTNLAAAIDLAIATMPPDTSNRILLVSDGNETEGAVRRGAELAKANGVPIDVLPIQYEHAREVIFEKIFAPARARQGQTAEVKLVLRSQARTAGTIRLSMNGEYLDLNGAADGDGLRVELEPGVTAIAQTISLDRSGPHQFEAVFIPDDPAHDSIDRNNTALAVTFVGGEGRLLIVDDGLTQSEHLVRACREAGIAVDVVYSDADVLAGGQVFLSAYDAVVLMNIPRWSFDDDQDRMLHAYVHDLGGGLVMMGGQESFGAGGWIDSEVARTLPVLLNPPQTRQMPAGALALIMHSCEMAQGNFWGQRIAEAAIETLSRLDYVGIVEFNWGGAAGIQGCAWAYHMQRLGDKGAALQATKTMQVGDMPAFDPSMQLAFNGLMGVPAAQRHAIIISDGDPSPPTPGLIQKFVDNRITCTMIMVGGHGTPLDQGQMQNVASKTGGTFYNVVNPKQLPQIIIKEAQIVSRSLIQDGDVYTPTVASTLPGPAKGFSEVPAIDGYVLTAEREGLAQAPIVIGTQDGRDPLFAHWNYGLGRAIAYTSDLTNLWGARWVGWARFQSFWEQAIRWVMRPSTPTNMHVATHLEGDTAIVELEALEADASFMNFLSPSALVLRPDHEREALSLQQTGPGRYRAQFTVDDAGSYLVSIAWRAGAEGEVHHLPAAVTVPYPREFRAVKHNAALLEELARSTGGRVLAWTDPAAADIYHRGELEVPKSAKRVWDLLAIIAASLLVIDVAARRISLDLQRMAGAMGKAIGRRGEASAVAVAAWKRTRSQVAHRREPAPVEGASDVRFEASAEDARSAIDVSAEGPGPGATAGRPAPARPLPPPAGEGAAEEPGQYTSRLLAAKRRARGEDVRGEDVPGGEPPGAEGPGRKGGDA